MEMLDNWLDNWLDNEFPRELACPITTDLMRDPVTAADGHTCERKFRTSFMYSSPSPGRRARSHRTLAAEQRL